ncbi:MAG: calcium-binding protein [Sedimentitalea sp.]
MTTLGPITFEDFAFADAVTLSAGMPTNSDFSGLLGASNQSFADVGVSNQSPEIEIQFTDNLVFNGAGVDLYIYVPGEVAGVTIAQTAGFMLGETLLAGGANPATELFFDSPPGNPFSFNPNSFLLAVDLDDLGFAANDAVTSLFIKRGDIEGGIYGVGAVNTIEFDVVQASSVRDRMDGSDFNDTLSGLGGNDIIKGRDGDDTLFGGSGQDTIRGNAGNDNLRGNDGADDIQGGSGEDTIFAGGGADDIKGDSGDDTINGGGGIDTIDGGTGDDKLTGGGNSDVFVFTDGFGNDRILDFAGNNDEKIDLSGVTDITDFQDLLDNHLSTDAQSGFALITAGSDSILLEGYEERKVGFFVQISGFDFLF